MYVEKEIMKEIWKIEEFIYIFEVEVNKLGEKIWKEFD